MYMLGSECLANLLTKQMCVVISGVLDFFSKLV